MEYSTLPVFTSKLHLLSVGRILVLLFKFVLVLTRQLSNNSRVSQDKNTPHSNPAFGDSRVDERLTTLKRLESLDNVSDLVQLSNDAVNTTNFMMEGWWCNVNHSVVSRTWSTMLALRLAACDATGIFGGTRICRAVSGCFKEIHEWSPGRVWSEMEVSRWWLPQPSAHHPFFQRQHLWAHQANGRKRNQLMDWCRGWSCCHYSWWLALHQRATRTGNYYYNNGEILQN